MFGELVQQIIQNGLSESSTEIGVWNNQMEWKPALDLMDNDDEICLYLTLPGVKNSSIDIDILNNRMMISGEREKPYIQANYQVKRSEIPFGRFQRVITLPIGVTNQGSVSTQFKDGILKVRIDKRVEQQNRFSVRVDTVDNEINN
jgi:HSP20 family protein